MHKPCDTKLTYFMAKRTQKLFCISFIIKINKYATAIMYTVICNSITHAISVTEKCLKRVGHNEDDRTGIQGTLLVILKVEQLQDVYYVHFFSIDQLMTPWSIPLRIFHVHTCI